jgi:hypothetical protein
LQVLRRFVFVFMSRRKARVALVSAMVAVAANQLSVVPVGAGSPASTTIPAANVSNAARSCTPGAASACTPATLPVTLPAGATQCPASGGGAACSTADSALKIGPGQAFTPEGLSPCAVSANHPGLSSPAACTDALLPTSGVDAAPSRGNSIGLPPTAPSGPVTTLRPDPAVQRLDLAVGRLFMQAGERAVLTATANASVTGTNTAIQIFDQTTHTLAGTCTQSSQCSVAYSASAGIHTFAAFVARPSTQQPSGNVQSVASNPVSVAWLGVTLKASDSVVTPGKPVTFTATSTFDVSKAGRSIAIYDNTMKRPITFCSRGTTCSTSLMLGGVHELIGVVPGDPQAMSQPVTATWLGAAISANAQTGGTVHLQATANADLTNTPWVLGIYDQHGQLVGQPCKNGNTCGADVNVPGGTPPQFSAVIGALPTPTSDTSIFGRLLRKVERPAPTTALVNVQARSAAMQLQSTRILWGVDSCRSILAIFSQTVARFGKPDFWGRYLTNTVCPGIGADEVAAAAREHIGLLPIYNDYNCSNVSGHQTGLEYAAVAVNTAKNLGIPKGRVLAIDIEPAGAACPGAANVDGGFIQGWFEGVFGAGYAPTYYGNGTAGSEFASAWCAAVAATPVVAEQSYLWSFQPSLMGSFTKGNSTAYNPYHTGCPSHTTAWQYQIDSSMPGPSNVDLDQAVSTMPLWYPS